MNRFTNIKTDLVDRIPLDSKELFAIPWVFISSMPFELNDIELENVGRYLMEGGFIVGDAASFGSGWVGGTRDISLRKMFKRALAKVNRRCEFVKITGEHSIFHCYFDFDMPPECSGTNGKYNPDYLIGVYVDRRLAGVICYNGIGRRWHEIGDSYGNIKGRRDNTRQLQFGVNLIVFALTQKGSITNRLMDTISVK